jgi:hypothetical protein
MTITPDDLYFDTEEFPACCGITVLTDLSTDGHISKKDSFDSKIWKTFWLDTLKENNVAMLMATTAQYQANEELLLKRTKWKKLKNTVNPKTNNLITIWTFTET